MLSTYPLTTEQIEIRDLAREFSRREIFPVSDLYENQDIAAGELPRKICHSGLVNGRIPADWGGLGLTLFDTALIAQELAYACSGIGSLVEASELAITVLLACASEEQKKRYLSMLAQEGGLAGIALPYGGGVDINHNLVAGQEGSFIILNGYCPLVLNADIAKWFIVSCSQGYFIVPADIAGLSWSVAGELFGRKAAHIKRADFDKVRLEPIARVDISLSIQENMSAQNAAIIASGCVGLAQSAFEHAKNYAQQRKTFGVPIASHQAIAFMLASMSTDIEAARLMVYQMIRSGADGVYSAKLGKSVQAFALDMVGRVTIDSVQIFGGYGYTRDYPVEKLMRDARTIECFYGPTLMLKEQLGQC